MSEVTKKDLKKISETIYEIPKTYRSDMRVPARVFANEAILEDIMQDRSLGQLVNTATLPGIVKHALAMPDIHQGYGFPIGGVIATDILAGGVISPGGIGYDINCGVRLLAASITKDEIKPYLEKVATALFHAVPSGVGQGGRLKLSSTDLDKVLREGAHRMLELGYGTQSDIEKCEENGRMQYVDVATISHEAKGDFFYLDRMHLDHLEVFDSRGKIKAVLNLDGKLNANKTKRAFNEGRTINI